MHINSFAIFNLLILTLVFIVRAKVSSEASGSSLQARNHLAQSGNYMKELLTGSGSNLSGQTRSGSNLSGQTGSGCKNFFRPDPDPDTSVLKIFHLFYDEF